MWLVVGVCCAIVINILIIYSLKKRIDYLQDRVDHMKKNIVSTNQRIDLVNRHLAGAHRRIDGLKETGRDPWAN